MKLKLADRIQVIQADDRTYIVDEEMMELEGCSAVQYEALKRLERGCELEEIGMLLTEEESGEMIVLLESQDWLRQDWVNTYIGDSVEKQIYYLDDFGSNPNKAQSKLSQATVAIIGVGGVGSVVLQHLVGAGVKSFILVDPDVVQKDNQNRQFIYPSTMIGESKVEAAKVYVHQIDPHIEVITYSCMIDSLESLQVLDQHAIHLLINAADQPANLYHMINDYCTNRRIAWIGGGVARQSGFWGPLYIPDQTICMTCFDTLELDEMDETERQVRSQVKSSLKASFGPTNTVISSLLVKDAILYLAYANKEIVPSAGMRCHFNFTTLETTRYAPSGEQASCSCWRSVAACITE